MAFTVKARVSGVAQLGNGQTTVSFGANYTDADGNRVNQEWAQATPAFENHIWVLDEVVVANDIREGQQYTLTYQAED